MVHQVGLLLHKFKVLLSKIDQVLLCRYPALLFLLMVLNFLLQLFAVPLFLKQLSLHFIQLLNGILVNVFQFIWKVNELFHLLFRLVLQSFSFLANLIFTFNSRLLHLTVLHFELLYFVSFHMGWLTLEIEPPRHLLRHLTQFQHSLEPLHITIITFPVNRWRLDIQPRNKRFTQRLLSDQPQDGITLTQKLTGASPLLGHLFIK